MPLGLLVWLLAPPVALAAPPEVTAYPGSLILGEGRGVELRVRTGGGSPAALRTACNVGRFGDRTVAGDEVRVSWTPPDVRYPHTALLLFWMDPGGAEPPDVAAVRVPLLGRMDLDVTTEPRADVMVEIGQKTFGPQKADGRGQAKVPIEVPPGTRKARVLSYFGGTSTAVELPLDVPVTNPLVAAAGPDPMPRDGGWLWIIHAGKMDPTALVVETIGGQARLIDGQPDRALFELTALPDSQRLAVTVKVPDDPEAIIGASLKVTDRTSSAPPKRRAAGWVLASSAHAGGFFGGGSNLGWLLGVDVSLIPPLLGGRAAVGGQLEVRSMGLVTSITGLGPLESWVIGPSLAAVARFNVVETGPVSVHARAGAGLLLYTHRVKTGFQPTFTEVGATRDLFVGAQVVYRVGPLDLFLEARGALAAVQTGRLDARMGGLVLTLGGRVY